jgi:hypothetical protein
MHGDHASGAHSLSLTGSHGRHRHGRHRRRRSYAALIFPGLPLAVLLLAVPLFPRPAAHIAALAQLRTQITSPGHLAAATVLPDQVLTIKAARALDGYRASAARRAAQNAPSSSLRPVRIPRPHHTRPASAAPPAPSQIPVGGMSAFEACVISRESGGNPAAYNPASGAGGLFQFLPSTWASLGFASAYPGGAQTAPASVQEQAFAKLYAEAGTSPWAPYDGC